MRFVSWVLREEERGGGDLELACHRQQSEFERESIFTLLFFGNEWFVLGI